MVAKIIAIQPKIVDRNEKLLPAVIKAPKRVIPDIAFDPDIKGVCNVEGTFDISSNPKNIVKMKINNSKNMDIINYLFLDLKRFDSF